MLRDKPEAVILDWDYTMVTRGGRHFFDGGDGKIKGAVKSSIVAGVGRVPERITNGRMALEARIRRMFPAKLNEGAEGFVNGLLSENIPVFILSNGSEELVVEEVHALLGPEIASRIHVYGKRPNEPIKPDHKAFTRLLDEHGIAPSSKVVMIGDSIKHDIKPACELGLSPILLTSKRGSHAELKNYMQSTSTLIPHIERFKGIGKALPALRGSIER